MKSVAAKHDNRQRNAFMVVERHFPSISVTEVLEYDFLGIKLAVTVRVSAR